MVSFGSLAGAFPVFFREWRTRSVRANPAYCCQLGSDSSKSFTPGRQWTRWAGDSHTVNKNSSESEEPPSSSVSSSSHVSLSSPSGISSPHLPDRDRSSSEASRLLIALQL